MGRDPVEEVVADAEVNGEDSDAEDALDFRLCFTCSALPFAVDSSFWEDLLIRSAPAAANSCPRCTAASVFAFIFSILLSVLDFNVSFSSPLTDVVDCEGEA